MLFFVIAGSQTWKASSSQIYQSIHQLEKDLQFANHISL